jgi:hypothetical protein
MTLRQATIIATPQPGTSNQPYPVGKLPPFVPVVTTIVDTDAAAIIAKTAALELTLLSVDSDLFSLNSNLAKYLEQQQAITDLIGAIDVAIQGYAASISYQTIMVASAASNQIQTNNFNNAVTKDESVKMPSLPEQYTQTIQDAILIKEAANGAAIVTNFATEQAGKTIGWITGTETYKDTQGWLGRQIDRIKALLFPPSPDTVVSQASAVSLAKVPGK